MICETDVIYCNLMYWCRLALPPPWTWETGKQISPTESPEARAKLHAADAIESFAVPATHRNSGLHYDSVWYPCISCRSLTIDNCIIQFVAGITIARDYPVISSNPLHLQTIRTKGMCGEDKAIRILLEGRIRDFGLYENNDKAHLSMFYVYMYKYIDNHI